MPGSDRSVTFIGNATLLIRYGSLTILTDPNFVHRHDKVSIGYGLHATRLTDPALELADLPPIDLVVLSHFHGDHFDQVAERDLDKALPIVTPPDAAEELRRRDFTAVHALSTWDTYQHATGDVSVRVTAVPGKHGPAAVDFALPDVMGSLLELEDRQSGSRASLYITGDTLIFDALAEIPRRYPQIDVAFLHLGGTRVMGIMVTMDGKQGVEMLRLVQPARAIPIHFDDYDLFTSPLSDFQQEVQDVQAAGLRTAVTYLDRGDSFSLEPAALLTSS
jgi:L-ascorbate metabolism protein UlaG (beta-lactamase superfamily)